MPDQKTDNERKALEQLATKVAKDFIKNYEGDNPVTMYKELQKKLDETDNLKGVLGRFELETLMKSTKRVENLNKDEKPRKNPIGAELIYAKKGGMITKSKPKVAGRLAKRGYGKAMKGKK
tara:strand:+ start:198 stop:560 length:363 start_codon:yes stop_codon:yes gene_type:complete